MDLEDLYNIVNDTLLNNGKEAMHSLLSSLSNPHYKDLCKMAVEKENYSLVNALSANNNVSNTSGQAVATDEENSSQFNSTNTRKRTIMAVQLVKGSVNTQQEQSLWQELSKLMNLPDQIKPVRGRDEITTEQALPVFLQCSTKGYSPAKLLQMWADLMSKYPSGKDITLSDGSVVFVKFVTEVIDVEAAKKKKVVNDKSSKDKAKHEQAGIKIIDKCNETVVAEEIPKLINRPDLRATLVTQPDGLYTIRWGSEDSKNIKIWEIMDSWTKLITRTASDDDAKSTVYTIRRSGISINVVLSLEPENRRERVNKPPARNTDTASQNMPPPLYEEVVADEKKVYSHENRPSARIIDDGSEQGPADGACRLECDEITLDAFKIFCKKELSQYPGITFKPSYKKGDLLWYEIDHKSSKSKKAVLDLFDERFIPCCTVKADTPATSKIETRIPKCDVDYDKIMRAYVIHGPVNASEMQKARDYVLQSLPAVVPFVITGEDRAYYELCSEIARKSAKAPANCCIKVCPTKFSFEVFDLDSDKLTKLTQELDQLQRLPWDKTSLRGVAECEVDMINKCFGQLQMHACVVLKNSNATLLSRDAAAGQVLSNRVSVIRPEFINREETMKMCKDKDVQIGISKTCAVFMSKDTDSLNFVTSNIPMRMKLDVGQEVFMSTLSVQAAIKPMMADVDVNDKFVTFKCAAKNIDRVTKQLCEMITVKLVDCHWPLKLVDLIKQSAKSEGCSISSCGKPKLKISGSAVTVETYAKVVATKFLVGHVKLSKEQCDFVVNHKWFVSKTKARPAAPPPAARSGHASHSPPVPTIQYWETNIKEMPRAVQLAESTVLSYYANEKEITLFGYRQDELSAIKEAIEEYLTQHAEVTLVFDINEFAKSRSGNTGGFMGFIKRIRGMKADVLNVPETVKLVYHWVNRNDRSSTQQQNNITLTGPTGAVDVAVERLRTLASTHKELRFEVRSQEKNEKAFDSVAEYYKDTFQPDAPDEIHAFVRVKQREPRECPVVECILDGPADLVDSTAVIIKKRLSEVVSKLTTIPATDDDNWADKLKEMAKTEGCQCRAFTTKSKTNDSVNYNVVATGFESSVKQFFESISLKTDVVKLYIRRQLVNPSLVSEIKNACAGVKISLETGCIIIRGSTELVKNAEMKAKALVYDKLKDDVAAKFDIGPVYAKIATSENAIETMKLKFRKQDLHYSGLVPWSGCDSPSIQSLTCSSMNNTDGLVINIALGDMLQWRVGIHEGGDVNEKHYVDAIIDPANSNLTAVGGLSRVIKDAAGPQYASAMAALRTPVLLTKVITQRVGDRAGTLLNNKGVIHAVGPHFVSDCNKNRETALVYVKETMSNVLAECDRYGYKSVACPAISSGIFQVPSDVVAEGIAAAVAEYSKKSGTSLDEFNLVLKDDLAVFTYAFGNALSAANINSKFSSVRIEATQNDEDEDDTDDEEPESIPTDVDVVVTEQFEWQDNEGNSQARGQWFKYDDDSNKKLFREHTSGNATCVLCIPSKKYPAQFEPAYEINFNTKKQKNVKTEWERPIRWTNITPVVSQQYRWQYISAKNDQAVDYQKDDNDQIERNFQNGINNFKITKSDTVSYGTREFSIDLTAMTQTGLNADGAHIVYPIRRLERGKVTHSCDMKTLAKANAKSNKNCVEVYGPRDKVEALTVSSITDALKSFGTSTNLTLKARLPQAKIDSVCSKFSVLVMGDTELKVFGHHDCVLQACLELGKSEGEGDLPKNWTAQTGNCALIDIPATDPEFDRIRRRIAETNKTVVMTKLQRVQNKSLWRLYSSQKSYITNKYVRLTGVNSDAKTLELFNGTLKNPPSFIYNGEKAFDKNFSRPGMWGIACYFAVNAQYSIGYSHELQDQPGFIQMFLAEVLIGHEIYVPESDPSRTELRMPPPNVSENFANPGEYEVIRHDCVKGNTAGSDTYMVYDDNRAYPKYLITMKKN